MFKRPLQVDINADPTIEHKVDLDPNVIYEAFNFVETVEKSVTRVIIVAAVAVTTSSVLTHIVKTKIK